MSVQGVHQGKEGEAGTSIWALLQSRLEQGVSVKLLDGTTRTGFVHAVDPQEPCALLIVKPNISNTQWGISAVFADGIAHCEAVEMGVESYDQVVKDCPLLKQVEVVPLDAEEIAQRREVAVSTLKQHGLSVTTEGGDLVVLGGMARIGPPYGPNDCRTANSQVYQRLAALLPPL